MIRVPYVKDKAQVEKVIEEAKENNGIICYTVVSPELREHIAHKAMEHDVEVVDVLGPMLKAIEDFDEKQGFSFSTLLKAYVRQHLNRLYNEATRKKRFTGSTPVSYESLVEINKEGGSELDSSFTVELEDISSVEFMDLLRSLNLNDKEQVAVNVLMAGGTKGEVAKALKCTPATANYYFKSIRKKFVFAGVAV